MILMVTVFLLFNYTINPPFLAYGAGFGEEALQAYFVAMQRALEPE